jgi:hypothetical protein
MSRPPGRNHLTAAANLRQMGAINERNVPRMRN